MVFGAGFDNVPHILPHPSPQPFAPELFLQPEDSGRDQTNFLLTTYKQNKTGLRQGTASFFASNRILSFESFPWDRFG